MVEVALLKTTFAKRAQFYQPVSKMPEAFSIPESTHLDVVELSEQSWMTRAESLSVPWTKAVEAAVENESALHALELQLDGRLGQLIALKSIESLRLWTEHVGEAWYTSRRRSNRNQLEL
ncbi:hypothetical protein M378DRAFT_165208 [Amanita muscaria Koide BX008]|uniref:Uncharacterized protein n=1 Tax=Amanita muscaria (strain Koide BX008) TaxID=946122 RepID=A0A0C2SIC9_AMAMK|nr:hypothetical protein M378DRAFT_165208 [Amanita muscaria Koide BX008]